MGVREARASLESGRRGLNLCQGSRGPRRGPGNPPRTLASLWQGQKQSAVRVTSWVWLSFLLAPDGRDHRFLPHRPGNGGRSAREVKGRCPRRAGLGSLFHVPQLLFKPLQGLGASPEAQECLVAEGWMAGALRQQCVFALRWTGDQDAHREVQGSARTCGLQCPEEAQRECRPPGRADARRAAGCRPGAPDLGSCLPDLDLGTQVTALESQGALPTIRTLVRVAQEVRGRHWDRAGGPPEGPRPCPPLRCWAWGALAAMRSAVLQTLSLSGSRM